MSVTSAGIETPATVMLVAPQGNADAILWGEEQGADLEWRLSDGAAWTPIDVRPPRYGVFAVALPGTTTVQLRALPGAPREAKAILQVSCGDPELDALPACLAHLSEPDTTATGGLCEALRLHTAASAASRRGAFAGAVTLYLQASTAWSARQDKVRAAAAMLGRAESLVRLGRYAEGERAARDAERGNTSAGNAYFAARSRSEACIALRELGKRNSARTCLTTLAPSFAAVGEMGDAANTYVSLASMANEDGEVEAAASALAAAQRLDLRAAHPEVGARLLVMAAEFDIAAGRVSSALAHLSDAAQVFESTKNDRWLGNVFLQLASVYWALGARAEAITFANDAVERFPREHSAGRRADALRLLGRVHVASGDDEAARSAFQEALSIVSSESTPIAALTLNLDLAFVGDGDALTRSEEAVARGGASDRQRTRFLAARAVVFEAQGRYDEVIAADRLMREDLLDWSDRVRWRASQSLALAHRERANDALDLLESDIYLLRERVARSRSAGLRQMAGTRLRDFRSAWVDIYTMLPPLKRPAVERLWRLLRDTQVASIAGPAAQDLRTVSTTEADNALAYALLEPPDSAASQQLDRVTRRTFTRYFAQTGDASPRPVASISGNVSSLTQLQSALPDGVVLLAFGMGSRSSVALSLERDRADVRVIASGRTVANAASRLRNAVSTPVTSLNEINEAADRLSTILVGSDIPRLPDRLIVVGDTLLEGVPLSLLTWPGQPQWLADTTPTSMTVSFPDRGEPNIQPTSELWVVAAMVDGGKHTSLPALASVSRESETIADAAPRIRVKAAAPAHDLRSLLDTPAAWIHVATHGTTRPGPVGYSGLWLDDAAEGNPHLFSWLDAVAKPSSADLVVLNACSLASSDPRSTAGTSLAAALSASGVRHVVAPMWLLSDTAGAAWAPAFYRAIEKNGEVDVGKALLAAQHHLRRSRHFSHPFFWASLVHFDH